MTKEEKAKIEELELEVNGDIPEYIKILSPEVIKVKCLNGRSSEWYVFTPQDVKDYFKSEINNQSGLRSIGNLSGDWRKIHELSKRLLYLFQRLGSIKLKENA